MQTVLNPGIITGTFKTELKNRFLCEVEINGKSTVCYVPSSCHLSNFLSLQGKTVYLLPTLSKKARTSYSVFAVPYKRSHILLNTSLANMVIKDNLNSRRFSFLGPRSIVYKEHYIGGYKSDLFIGDTNTIIEIKSVLSTDSKAKFPTVFSERSLRQLSQLKSLLLSGFRVHYIIVSLNPYTTAIKLISQTQLAKELNECRKLGMTFSAFSCKLTDNRVFLNRKLQIENS